MKCTSNTDGFHRYTSSWYDPVACLSVSRCSCRARSFLTDERRHGGRIRG